ncbi:MAG: hypothetical protein ACTH8F_00055 [Microbacterium sp.]|uniref:hypothetical protein n=1 Tax=Microbacterium sp. TaxID=51671 RepID=UPI003F98EAD6
MTEQISGDFDAMLENINTLVKGIEAGGVGTRDTQVDGVHTLTTASYLDSATVRAASIEGLIATLVGDMISFRDAVKDVLQQKEESEGTLSTMLAQVAAAVDDPTQTSMETADTTADAADEVVANGGAQNPYGTSGSDEDDS